MSSRTNGMIATANRILAANSAFDRTVYLRVVTSTGGDPLIGRYGDTTTTDTLLSPQPYVERLGRERIPGWHPNSTPLLINNAMKQSDIYQLIVTSSMVTRFQLQDPTVQFVFKDTDATEEVVSIHDFETVALDNADIAFIIYAGSVTQQ